MIQKKIDAQIKYCLENKLPLFMSRSGLCWACHGQLMNYYSLEYVSNNLITGCPYCHRSFCE